jgi:atypical dual specificity phosphatase
MTATCGFYWLYPNKLAGSAYPGTCLDWLYNEMGIRSLISLHPLDPEDQVNAQNLGLKTTTVPIEDFTPGTPEQRNQALQAIQTSLLQQEPVLVHCKGGLGRTGMILALYLVREEKISAKTAIKRIRRLRPQAIETPEQEAAIHTYGRMHDS